MSDWEMIRDRLAALRRQEQIEAAWREHKREWTPLSNLGRPRPQQGKREYLH